MADVAEKTAEPKPDAPPAEKAEEGEEGKSLAGENKTIRNH